MDKKKITTHYFVRVYKNGELFNDVGPFDSISQEFGDEIGALDWIYQQIGLLKTHFPKQELKKEKWIYQRPKGLFEEPNINIILSIAEYKFEIFKLSPSKFSRVVEQLIEDLNLSEFNKKK